jgi:protein SCO1/2
MTKRIPTIQGKSALRLLLAVAAIAALSSYLIMQQLHNRRFPQGLRGFAVEPTPITDVRLVDKTGQALGNDYFKGKWTLVFFGYTNCPDVCPSTLMELTLLKKSLHTHAEQGPYQYLFVTVDPQRDSLARIREYVEYFDPQFNAAAGDITRIKQFESIFGASHLYAKHTADDVHYNVAHSAEIYIVDPDANYVARFLPPFNVSKVVAKLSELHEFINREGNKA